MPPTRPRRAAARPQNRLAARQARATKQENRADTLPHNVLKTPLVRSATRPTDNTLRKRPLRNKLPDTSTQKPIPRRPVHHMFFQLEDPHVPPIGFVGPRPYRVYRRVPITPAITSAWLAELLELVNEERKRHGLHLVSIHPRLTRVAELHNADQAMKLVSLSHVGADGSGLKQRLKREGYMLRYAAENVAAGQTSPKRVHTSWMRSAGHRKNVLNPNVRELGMCVGHGADGRLFWTQVFGSRMGQV